MPLPKVHKHVQDQNGNIVPEVLGSVYNQGTGVLATLYQDDAGTTPLGNPMTSDAQYGSFQFYIDPGHYDMTFTKPGYTFQTIYDMQVVEDVLTLGTMATQNANAVAITGGTATLANLGVTGANPSPSVSSAQFGAQRWVLGSNPGDHAMTGMIDYGAASPTAMSIIGRGTSATNRLLRLYDMLGIGVEPQPTRIIALGHLKGSNTAILIQPLDSDAGAYSAMTFANLAGAVVGTIQTTAGGTAYNTTSDGRLKEALTPLTGALATVMRLLPRTFRWKQDGRPGVGFVAEEVAQVVEGVTTGTPGAVQPDGRIDPMQMDHSKLVPWIVGAVQEVTKRLEALEHAVALIAQRLEA